MTEPEPRSLKIADLQERAFFESTLPTERSVVHGVKAENVLSVNENISQLSSGGDGEMRASIVVQGTPYFGTEATSARITFQPDGGPLSKPSFDATLRRIQMYLPVSQFHDIYDRLRGSDLALCVYAESQSIDRKYAYVSTYNRT